MSLEVDIGILSSLSLQSKLLKRIKEEQETDPYLNKVRKKVEEGKEHI